MDFLQRFSLSIGVHYSLSDEVITVGKNPTGIP